MHKFLVSLTLALATALAGWWLRSAQVSWSWQPDWPQAIRAQGEAVERYVASGRGKPTEADRARAAERARWKAYYVAQLRAAEQVGGLELAAGTTLHELALEDQELRASYEGTLRAAREIASEGRLEALQDGVKARVVVEVPRAPLESLRGTLLAALRGGRLSFERREPAGPLFSFARPAFAESAPAPRSRTAPAPAAAPSSKRPAAPKRGAAEPPPAAAPVAATGIVLELTKGAALLGATPTVYDAAGTRLGTVFDLPAERLAAGLPVASPGDAAAVREWAGERPRRYSVRVVKRDLFLADRLDAAAATEFRERLREGRIVLLLGGAS